MKRIDCLLPSSGATTPIALALQGCEVDRPAAFDASVEVVSAGAVPRAFPTRVSEGLGVCIKWGPTHDVIANGRAILYPADALCVRTPGCVWSCDAARVGFLSVDVASELLPMDVGPPAMRFTPAGDRRRWRMLIRRLGTDDPLDRQEALVDLLFAAIPQPLRGLPDPVTGVERQVARVRELLHATLDEDLSLDRLAAHLGANKFVLVRSFRKLTGTTPYQYRTLLRVERARELLALGVSPGEAAAIAGFADQPHMTRSFKRVFGLTPSAYVRGPRGRFKATTASR